MPLSHRSIPVFACRPRVLISLLKQTLTLNPVHHGGGPLGWFPTSLEGHFIRLKRPKGSLLWASWQHGQLWPNIASKTGLAHARYGSRRFPQMHERFRTSLHKHTLPNLTFRAGLRLQHIVHRCSSSVSAWAARLCAD